MGELKVCVDDLTKLSNGEQDMSGGKSGGNHHHESSREGQKTPILLILTILVAAVGVGAAVWFPTAELISQLKVLVKVLKNFKIDVPEPVVVTTPSPKEESTEPVVPRDCYDIFELGQINSGVYKIYPANIRRGINVYCDMKTDEGGWLTIQKREDGSEDFGKGWNDYQIGFGDITKEFWLGNEYIHRITSQGVYELRIDMSDFEGEHRHAKYKIFSVSSNENLYRVTISGYSGNAGDSLSGHNKMPFSTMDNDNDNAPGNCATSFKGGFWYHNCHGANPNGQYFNGGHHEALAIGINWQAWKGYKYSMKTFEMKIRPL